MQLEIQQYLDKGRNYQEYLLEFFSNDINTFQEFIENIESIRDQNDRLEFMSFLYLLSNIANNYHRMPNFFNKIDSILLNYKDYIKQNFSQIELFKIFKKSKRILLFLLDNKMLTMTQGMADTITKEFYRKADYPAYFYYEIRPFINSRLREEIEAKIGQITPDEFNIKRKNAENDNYICNLIRNDLIDDFKQRISTSSLSQYPKLIEPSIFETNFFLLNRKPTLIEYSAFFGSSDIFKFLNESKNKLPQSIWLYAIHGNKSDIIQIIEQNNVKPKDESFHECLIEAIKCHHLEIIEKFTQAHPDIISDLIPQIIESYNFAYFPDDKLIDNDTVWHNLNLNNYALFVNIFIKNQEFDVNKLTISIIFFFNL
ncbi:hypothetical protein M9Y10_029510 [Tritrichomonas musculus]|uniref:DUF3447 domain-containing protein n=1 Tax=Tritrichomonas musculus TaxID=1915356 RepID=A0ABR2KMD7_9EUKA